ncbi:MarR family transcriptional regulator [Listeria monocytogenes]|nr:MarR family transcriptional regulator [Listeria monocytogenes]
MRNILNEAALTKNITIVQLLVANIIHNKPGISPAKIANEMNLGKSTVSGIINRIVKNGFATKIQSAENRRSYGLHLTQLGKDKVNKTYDISVKHLMPLLDIPKADLDHLLNVHNQILQIIGEVKTNGYY